MPLRSPGKGGVIHDVIQKFAEKPWVLIIIRSFCKLQHPTAMSQLVGTISEPLGRSWGGLGGSGGALGGVLGRSWAVLGRSWGDLGRHLEQSKLRSIF